MGQNMSLSKVSSWFKPPTSNAPPATWIKRPASNIFNELSKVSADDAAAPKLVSEAVHVINTRGESQLARFIEVVSEPRGQSGLIERQLVAELQNRTVAKAATDCFAMMDLDFKALTYMADTARDSKRFKQAQAAYASALALYPLHAGYRVQLAHMYKDQGLFEDAEVHYRTALALGCELDQVLEHLTWTAERLGHTVDRDVMERQAAFWMETATADNPWTLPTIAQDVVDLADLFGLPPLLSASAILGPFRAAPFLSDLPSCLLIAAADRELPLMAIAAARLATQVARVG
jgi:tetratricopeptide (TPR) repeat protein